VGSGVGSGFDDGVGDMGACLHVGGAAAAFKASAFSLAPALVMRRGDGGTSAPLLHCQGGFRLLLVEAKEDQVRCSFRPHSSS
jgi:hypothetical protein